MISRGIHTRPNKGASIEWMTPPHIITALGRFDMDPCAHPLKPFKTAETMITPPSNGLKEKWSGRVWLNPPYGENHLWLSKLVEHGNGIALTASRTEVNKWFVPFVWEKATAILFIYGRLFYYKPTGERGAGNAGHGSCLVAYGESNASALLHSGINGKFISLNTL